MLGIVLIVACLLSAQFFATRTVTGTEPAVVWPVSLDTLGPKKLKPSASSTRFADWISDILCGDSVWFPALWVPVVLYLLHPKEDAHRAANRRMQFKGGQLHQADWIQLPVEVFTRPSYIEEFCHVAD